MAFICKICKNQSLINHTQNGRSMGLVTTFPRQIMVFGNEQFKNLSKIEKKSNRARFWCAPNYCPYILYHFLKFGANSLNGVQNFHQKPSRLTTIAIATWSDGPKWLITKNISWFLTADYAWNHLKVYWEAPNGFFSAK